ncbi:MAG: peptidoglycan domain protein [Bacteroidales bacterium]|nr:peptidoglycan domain protein [Bacteroidales bacterium]
MADYKKLKPFILKWEGDFSNHPKDKGGATNKGITIATFRSVFGKDKTVADLKNMTDSEWDYIFKKYFWDRWQADKIVCQSVANILVDWVWASGKYGITIPQELLSVQPDGIVGVQTLTALNNQNSKEFFDKVKKRRLEYCLRIVKNDTKQKVFLQGWQNRINAIKFCQ